MLHKTFRRLTAVGQIATFQFIYAVRFEIIFKVHSHAALPTNHIEASLRHSHQLGADWYDIIPRCVL
jgi:hypothetical protein